MLGDDGIDGSGKEKVNKREDAICLMALESSPYIFFCFKDQLFP